MKYIYNKNFKLRKMLLTLTNKYYLLKLFVKNNFLNSTLKFNLVSIFYKIFNKFSFIKIVNKCSITFNKKVFNKLQFYSRFVYFKKLINGSIFGILK